MISAAEAQLVGCPLPASVVERTESIRRRVALSCSVCNATRSKVSTVIPFTPLPFRMVAAQRGDTPFEYAGLFQSGLGLSIGFSFGSRFLITRKLLDAYVVVIHSRIRKHGVHGLRHGWWPGDVVDRR
jgi:hypothetical protein